MKFGVPLRPGESYPPVPEVPEVEIRRVMDELDVTPEQAKMLYVLYGV